MRMARAVMLLALALPLTACSDPSDPMATATDLPALAADLESQGAVVERTQGTIAVVWWDPDTELIAAHVFREPYAVCPPGAPIQDLYVSDFKDVISSQAPEDVDLVRTLMQTKEISIKVWHSTSPQWTVALRCSPPIASGVGQILYTDNDALAYAADRMKANAYGYTAQATLTDADGQRYHYNAIWRSKWQPNSGEADYRATEVRRINLVPVGQ